LTPGVLRAAIKRLRAIIAPDGPTYSPHDLRRTCANRAAEDLDFDTETIAALLSHRSGGVTDAHYTQASKLNRIRRLVEAWSSHLLSIVERQTADSRPDEKVVDLMARKTA
jgi:integrase